MSNIKDSAEQTRQAKASCPNKPRCNVVTIIAGEHTYLLCTTCNKKVK